MGANANGEYSGPERQWHVTGTTTINYVTGVVASAGITTFCVACGCTLCACEKPEPVAVPEAPLHWWGEWRGRAQFCRKCGENSGLFFQYPSSRPCPGDIGPDRREANIEAWIERHMYINHHHRILPVVRGTEPAWSNITAALNAPPGWNRR